MTADREYLKRFFEWRVSTAGPWGATWVDLDKKMSMAAQKYRKLHGIPRDSAIPDDALRIRAGDDEVVIYFDVEVEAA